jgi:hypothetical protein
MSADSVHHSAPAPSERRPAVWPWLLLPLVTLVLFFALQTAKRNLPSPDAAGQDTPAAASSAAPEAH